MRSPELFSFDPPIRLVESKAGGGFFDNGNIIMYNRDNLALNLNICHRKLREAVEKSSKAKEGIRRDL
jgi:hypothetical protein